MINIEMMKEYIDRAKWCLKEAELAYSAGNNPITVRRAQEALELTVKGMLRYLGVEYPKEHDVSDVLDVIKSKLPDYILQELETLKKVMHELAGMRGPAFYGFEMEGFNSSKIFTKKYAEQALENVRKLTSLCFKFLEER